MSLLNAIAGLRRAIDESGPTWGEYFETTIELEPQAFASLLRDTEAVMRFMATRVGLEGCKDIKIYGITVREALPKRLCGGDD